MTFTLLPEILRGIILIFATLVLFVYMYSFIHLLHLGIERGYTVCTGLLLLLAFVLYQGMVIYHTGDSESFNVPVVLLVVVYTLLLIFAILLRRNILRWHNENISSMSVKEAYDRLPSGLLYYIPSGIPVMINKAMQGISRDLYGRSITDGNRFWEEITGEKQEDIISDENTAIVKLQDGRVCSFKRNAVDVNKTTVYEVIAVDITSEYRLSEELDEKQNRAKNLNNRLKALMGTIEYVTMNRELLQLKIALHDNIGQSILLAKRYLYSPDSVDVGRMLEFWQDNIRHLVSDEPEEWELPYYVISKEADRLGIRLKILGELPKEQELIPVVDEAISVHIGNTLKHTDSDEVTAAVSDRDGEYVISLKNDDHSPVGEVSERGGLKNLRNEVERVGGSLEIITDPEFELRIRLPKRRGNEIWHIE